MIVPFIKVEKNPPEGQVTYEKKALDNAMKEASNSVGEMIRFGKLLRKSQQYFDKDLMPFMQQCVGDDRLLTIYSIALFAAEKVFKLLICMFATKTLK